MSLLNQLAGRLGGSSKRPVVSGRPTKPNTCAHLCLFCAMTPAVIVLIAILFAQTYPNRIERIQHITDLAVPLITLAGAALGLSGARCYWRDTRRGGIGLVALGLLGCGAWVIWFDSLFDALRRFL
jgi:hypothetical protein